MTNDPKELARLSRCYCFPGGSWKSIWAYLLCKLKGAAVSCGTPSDSIVLSGAGNISANLTFYWNGVDGWLATSGAVLANVGTGWDVIDTLGRHIYHSGNSEFPCVWHQTVSPQSTSPAPSGVYGVGLCGAKSNRIQISGAGTVAANQVYTLNPATGIWTSADTLYTLSFNSVWSIGGPVGGDYYLAYSLPPTLFPCTWEPADNGDPPGPTGQYI